MLEILRDGGFPESWGYSQIIHFRILRKPSIWGTPPFIETPIARRRNWRSVAESWKRWDVLQPRDRQIAAGSLWGANWRLELRVSQAQGS